ncbi:hypothetical protein T552_01793 [Pneumocystis carinii B80]|uniref:Uncharacterized protein n=1 Tax=Pneumocystis carinii (strain B80) TaxID=1408658 RepID=A0A0W4ZJM3_PNEC8|nr:hypothetical protein T552_01793 [Pneumocystis carinii B80]KTW28533.1 hypothetical protein T552_01793 [Pneumocystis carinii B80]
MQENEAPKPEETDPNSFRKAVEIVFNEVYSSVVPEKSIESQNLMKFEEKFQKAMQQMTAAKTEPSPVYEPYLQENIVDKELLKSQSGLLRVRGRPAQRRSHNPENKKGLGLKGFKVDGRRTKSKMIGGAILPRANIYMPKRRSRSGRNQNKSYINGKSFLSLPIIPDVTEVIVNKRRKSSGSMYRTSRRINLDYLWMMHWKLKSRKKVPKKYSTRDILFRMLSKWRKSQDKG